MAKQILDSVQIDGAVTATSVVKSGGTPLQLLKADGTVLTLTNTGSQYLRDDGTFAPVSGGTGGSDANYVFNQILPASVWTINHGLNKFPSVIVVDSADTKVEGEVSFPSINQVVITFTGAFAGRAFLN